MEILALLPHLVRNFSSPTQPARSRPPETARSRSRSRTNQEQSGEEPAAPRKRGAGSLTRRITEIVRLRRDGLRFEEIQLRLKADPVELRETLGRMLDSGRLAREGKARGTRYKIAASTDLAKPSGVGGSPPPDRPPPPQIEVTDAMIDELRLQFLNADAPPNLPELQQKLPYTREQIKAILDRMRTDGLIERARGGPNPRYRLVSVPKKVASAIPPVIRAKKPREEEPSPATPPEPSPQVAPEVADR
ncbi:MAG: hypothetical protein NZX77_11245 [Polyangiaceae bacterium]|nr:hypothetical protein [Polyangiaceae bacterium]